MLPSVCLIQRREAGERYPQTKGAVLSPPVDWDEASREGSTGVLGLPAVLPGFASLEAGRKGWRGLAFLELASTIGMPQCLDKRMLA